MRIRPITAALLAAASLLLAARSRMAASPPGPGDFVVREWHVDDGLPSDDVLQLVEDTTGYLWVACRGSLVRFDGSTFRPPSAPEAHDSFVALAADRDGSLLLVPRDGDPLRLRDRHRTREPLPPPYGGRPIRYLLHAPDGARWYSVAGAALRIDGDDVRAFGPADGLSPHGWARFALDERGDVWVASDGFLGRYARGELRRVRLPDGIGELRIASSRHGGPWIITAGQILKSDGGDQFEAVTSLAPLVGAHYVNAAVEAHNGMLWLATRSQGVQVIAGSERFRVPTPTDTIITLIEDREGNVWVGGSTGGLAAISPRLCTLYDRHSGLAATAVAAICEDRLGAIWLANGDGGVARIQGTSVDHWLLPRASHLLAAGSVAPHPDGGVWVMAGAGTTVLHVRPDGVIAPPEPEFPGGFHATLYTAHNGDLWLTTADRRVGRRRGADYRVFGPADGLPAAGVRTFSELNGPSLCVGTNDGRVLRLEGERFVSALPAAAQSPSAINALQRIGDHLWLGTASHGILIWTGSRLVAMGTAAGLPDDSVAQLVPDDAGSVWCGSAHGVFRLALADVTAFLNGRTHAVTPLRLGRDDGLGAINCQGIVGPGAVRAHDGRIWFATRQGALVIRANPDALTPSPPVVAIEEVRCNGAAVSAGSPIELPADARKLEIEFSVLSLSAPSRINARYRLIGFDSEWVESGASRVAVFPHLPPGSYRFEAAAGSGASEFASTAAIEIRVRPVWWQTLWARLAAAVAAVGGIAGVVRAWSHRRLRRRVEKLERETAIARERARIARNIHDDVGASLTRISLLTQDATPGSPDSANLNQIYETAREITRSLDEIVWAVNPRYDSLESFVGYLTNFAQKFLGVAGVRCRLVIPPSLPAVPLGSELRHDLFLCCREALNNIVKHAGASEVTLRLVFDDPRLTIAIADNGRGFGRPATDHDDRVSSGQGLGNLRSRMERLGGSCTLESPAAGGTIVTLVVPLRAPCPLPDEDTRFDRR